MKLRRCYQGSQVCLSIICVDFTCSIRPRRVIFPEVQVRNQLIEKAGLKTAASGQWSPKCRLSWVYGMRDSVYLSFCVFLCLSKWKMNKESFYHVSLNNKRLAQWGWHCRGSALRKVKWQLRRHNFKYFFVGTPARVLGNANDEWSWWAFEAGHINGCPALNIEHP